MAELAGEDPESLVPAAGYYPNREAGIHDRYAWRKTPRLHEPARRHARVHLAGERLDDLHRGA